MSVARHLAVVSWLPLIAVAGLVIIAWPRPAKGAATIVVNTLADEDMNNGTCSVREAIVAANTNVSYNGLLGMAPLQAQCHLGLGRCHRHAGQREEACAQLTTAVDLFRALDMSNWLPRAEGERRACG